jgi:hypothetical protein
MKMFILLIPTVLSMAVAHAETYRHDIGRSENRLQSKEGLSIVVTAENYESGDVGDSQTNTAEEIKVSVNGSNVAYGSRIRAVITPNCKSGEYGWAISQPQIYSDLTSETDGSSLDFYGSFSETVMTHTAVHGGEWVNCAPTLSVVVDGNWQTDPVNGTHNFLIQYL